MTTRTISIEVRPGPRSRYRMLPLLGPVLDNLLAWLRLRGYRESTLRSYLKATGPLWRWLQLRRGRTLEGLRQQDLCAAYDHFRIRSAEAAAAALLLGRFLAEKQLIRLDKPEPLSPSEGELLLFNSYLRQVRGLASMTITGHQSRIRGFLQFLQFDEHPSAIRMLNLDRIEAFLRHVAKTNNRFSLQHIVASLRAFLRHQHAKGRLPKPLHLQIDTPRTYRLEQLPRALPWDQIVTLLRSIDQTTPGGLRDLTILYLAAHYGLRSSELVRLTLNDIDWRAGVLKITQNKTKQILWLPLTDEAGQILSNYLKSGRPLSPCRELFLRRRAPAGPLAPTAVHDILEHRIALSDVELPSMGCHVLRHSLAVRLLRRGVSLPTIGATLGHRDLESTTIYLRLATDDLREVGLPVPKGGSPATLHCQGWKQKMLPTQRASMVFLRRKGFRSGLASSLRCYLQTRRALGRAYRVEEGTLHRWDDFLWHYYRKARQVKPKMFLRWVETMLLLQVNVRRSRMRIVRNFLLFHARRHPRTFIPELLTFPKPSPRQPPYLVSPANMACILATANTLPSSHQNPLRAQTIRLALVLLYCCGLRRGELLRLRLCDFDPRQNIFRIENTKFHKSRLIPLSPSVAEEVHRYVKLRRRQRPVPEPDAFLLWSNNPLARARTYSAAALADNWRQLCLATGVLNEHGRPPRLHDLRHGFAVLALHRWYRQGKEVQSKLVHLSTYMGHVSPVSTHYYLHLSPELRQAANRLFHDYADPLFTLKGDR